MDKNSKIAVIGLGYVGLPLAIHFGAKFQTTGLDLKEKIIENCKKHQDPTGEVSKEEFKKAVF
jgi:UDP-N-acetyl-D-glucosamine/UDP-N-acetyl-D-galactosamine dehydrogenase